MAVKFGAEMEDNPGKFWQVGWGFAEYKEDCRGGEGRLVKLAVVWPWIVRMRL